MTDQADHTMEGPDDHTRRLVAEAADRLEAAWKTGADPRIEDFLPKCDEPAHTLLRVELVKIDIWHRWRRGQRKGLEEYLVGDWDNLHNAPEALAEMLTAECESRAVFDKLPHREELATRFPDVSDRIPLDEIKAQTASQRSKHAEADSLCGPGGSDVTLVFNQAGNSSLPELPAGHRLGRYITVRLIGQGAMARVYLAEDPELHREVAVKVPLPDTRGGWHVMWADRSQEAGDILAAKLKHPGIVPIFDLGRCADGTPFIVMEYVQGTSLAELLQAQRQPFDRIADVVSQVAEAMHHAHQHGVYHLDLKSSNVLIEQDGRALVTDFGLAVEENVQETLAGQCRGSPAYMSPEQVRGETNYLDGRADIWSMGVMLYELLTGRKPFRSQTVTDLYDEICSRDPKPPRMIEDSVPEPLEQICLKCLARSPTDRYRTAGDISRELKAYLRKGNVTRPWTFLKIAAGLSLVAILLAVAFVYLGTGPTTLKPAGSEKHTANGAIERQGQTVADASRLEGPNEVGSLRIELESLCDKVDAARGTGPDDDHTLELRKRLLDCRSRCLNHPEAVRDSALTMQTAQLMSRLPWPCDKLRVENVAPEFRQRWGVDLPDELVAVWGNNPQEESPPVWSVHFMPDGTHLVLATENEARILDAGNGERRGTLQHERRVTCALPTADGKTILTAGGGSIRSWNVESQREEAMVDYAERVRWGKLSSCYAATSPDGRWMASGSKSVWLWQLGVGGSLTKCRQLPMKRRLIGFDGTPLAFSPDSQTLAYVDVKAGVRLQAVGTGGSVGTIDTAKRRVLSLAFSPDGRILALGNESNNLGNASKTISLWHVELQPRLEKSLPCAGAVFSVAFSSDGSKFAAAVGKNLHVWELPPDITKQWPTTTQFRSPGEIYHLTFAPDSRHVVTGNEDGTVYVFRLAGPAGPLPEDVESPTEEP